MTRRDPFSEIEDLFERMDRELEKIGPAFDGSRSPGVAVDVVETDDEVVVTADLPGFDADSIDVELHEDALTIAATRENEHDGAADTDTEASPDADDGPGATEPAEPRYHRHERRHGSASRRIPIPVAVDPDGTSATYDDGVLTVTLPKRSSDSDGHRIDVQ
ncbi:HSP20 family protein [Halorubrum alkaliphilum]|uniref:HSP20 family protein n=1 Tax=Halorubrum alkaliphilum TaxID=261290 RepID=A0A8T4GFS9_9EURY|nr:Hsp20/alpha crystallin family protein [Halorubrum alkaliphilum]MBP1923384.1 HSP20 family protein [Halorubrum alkaliphilum]